MPQQDSKEKGSRIKEVTPIYVKVPFLPVEKSTQVKYEPEPQKSKENFDLRVPIQTSLEKSLILGLGSRPSIGIVLGFYGYWHEVMGLMQVLSHSTRAYILNPDANYLRGFLHKHDKSILDILDDSHLRGKLDYIKKYLNF